MSEQEGVVPASDFQATGREETPLAYRAVRGGIWVAAGSYWTIGFGFLANLALTRILAPEHFGIFALASFFFSFINIRPKLGLGPSFVQRSETNGGLLGTYLVLDVTAGLGTLLLAGAAAIVLRVLGYPGDVAVVVLALAAIGISDAVMGTAWLLLDKELQFRETSLVSSVVFPFAYVPAFVLALQGAGYWSLVAQSATFSLLLLVGMWWMVRRRLPHIWQFRWHFDRRLASSLLRFGSMIGIAGLAGMLVGQFDNFLVGSLVGVAALGFYDRAYRIAQWPFVLVTGVITRTGFYTYARLKDDPTRLQKTVTMTLWLIATLALPLSVGIFAAGPDLIRWLYGDRWLPSAVFLRFLVAYSVIRPVLDDAGSLFVAVGRPRLNVVVAGIEAAVLVVAGTLLTLRFGAVGTCVAVGITFAVGLGITYRYVIRVVAIRIKSSLGLPAVATLLTLAVYFSLIRVLDMNDWPLAIRAIGKLVFAMLVYFAVLFALRPKSTRERVQYVWRLARAR